MREEKRTGLDYLESVTTLLQRSRNAHPTHGSYEAGEIVFWWSIPRATDEVGQLFWFDDDDQPVAAVLVTDFGDGTSLLFEEPTISILFLADTDPTFVAQVVDRGLEHLTEHGITSFELEVGDDDETLRSVLLDRGFSIKGAGLVESWLNAEDRPEVSAVPSGYHLTSRAETLDRPHHMEGPRRLDVEERLNQTSLYRPELDLLVLDTNDELASYGLFWFDPVTETGVVEPMRTMDEHQQLGLARHVLTSGIDRMAVAGAKRIKIAFAEDNPGASRLYLDVGFQPHRSTELFSK